MSVSKLLRALLIFSLFYDYFTPKELSARPIYPFLPPGLQEEDLLDLCSSRSSPLACVSRSDPCCG